MPAVFKTEGSMRWLQEGFQVAAISGGDIIYKIKGWSVKERLVIGGNSTGNAHLIHLAAAGQAEQDDDPVANGRLPQSEQPVVLSSHGPDGPRDTFHSQIFLQQAPDRPGPNPGYLNGHTIGNGYPSGMPSYDSETNNISQMMPSGSSGLDFSSNAPATNGFYKTEYAPSPSVGTFRSSGQSPKLIDLLLPGTDLNARRTESVDYPGGQSGVQYHGLPTFPNNDEQNGDGGDEDIEEVIRQPYSIRDTWLRAYPSPATSSSSQSSEGSPIGVIAPLYRQVDLPAASPERLMLRFNKQTCSILSIKDGPTENPWRTLIWPMASDEPALFHALAAMTAFHMTKEAPAMRMHGMEHMRHSLQLLAANIGTMRTDAALATTLALAFSESWDEHISTGIRHLRGTKALVSQNLPGKCKSSMTEEEAARFRFLINTWVYMDVLSRLTSFGAGECHDFDQVIPSAYPSAHGPALAQAELDPLMGAASTLFPLLGRVANLVRRVRRTASNSPAIISRATTLKRRLEEWKVDAIYKQPEDPSSELEHSLQTAEAYRWATLLYLHQAVPEIPSLTTAQLTRKALQHLAAVPLSSRVVVVHIYPLLAAGSEAVGQEARDWVENRWAGLAQKMWIGNIDRCWEVVKEVWDRTDRLEARKSADEHRARVELGAPTSATSSSSSSQSSAKRKYSSVDEHGSGDYGWTNSTAETFDLQKKRAVTARESGPPAALRLSNGNMNGANGVRSGVFREANSSNLVREDIPFERTVRGNAHWLGVMRDWRWEGEFLVLSLFLLASLRLCRARMEEARTNLYDMQCSLADLPPKLNLSLTYITSITHGSFVQYYVLISPSL